MTTGPAAVDLQTVRLGVLSAIIDGDAGLAYRMVRDLLDGGMPFEAILVEILAPLQREVGLRWGAGDFRIADEHAATGAVETLVALLAGSFDRPGDAPHVLVACAEGDVHSLPPRMAAAYLMYRGWQVTFLGANMPADDLEDYVHEVDPDAVLISCAMAPWLLGARACVRAAHSAGVPVLVGGRAFGADEAIAGKIGADAWVPSLVDIDAILRDWDPDPVVAESAAATPSDEIARIVDLHPDLVARGLRELRELLADIGWPLEAVPDRNKEFGLLVSTLASAMLVGDAGVLTDFATTQAALLSEHGAPEEIGALFIRSLGTALGEGAPVASGYLATTLAAMSP